MLWRKFLDFASRTYDKIPLFYSFLLSGLRLPKLECALRGEVFGGLDEDLVQVEFDYTHGWRHEICHAYTHEAACRTRSLVALKPQ
jgi:hypothetical protein